MVHYDSWDQFATAATGIYMASPEQARYTIKYSNSGGALLLKVTDDTTCVQLRTERLDDIKRVAQLHRVLAQAAANRTAPVKALPPVFVELPKEDKPPVAKKQQVANQAKKKGRGKRT